MADSLRVTLRTSVGPLEISCLDRCLSSEEIPEDGEAAKSREFSSPIVLDRTGLGIGWTPLVGPIRSLFPPDRMYLQDRTSPDNPAGAPPVVLERIGEAFPREAREIVRSLRFTNVVYDQYWHFQRWGHFVGVEPDGHIHS